MFRHNFHAILAIRRIESVERNRKDPFRKIDMRVHFAQECTSACTSSPRPPFSMQTFAFAHPFVARALSSVSLEASNSDMVGVCVCEEKKIVRRLVKAELAIAQLLFDLWPLEEMGKTVHISFDVNWLWRGCADSGCNDFNYRGGVIFSENFVVNTSVILCTITYLTS